MRLTRRTPVAPGPVLFAIVALASVALPGRSAAQVLYSFPGARPVPDSSPALGATVGFGDHFFRLLGFGRFNVSRVSDLGFEIAYDDLNTGPGSSDSGRFGAGADFKYQVMEQDDRTPVDVAVGVGAGFLTQSSVTLVRIPFGAMASRTFTLDNDHDVVPYAGVYLVVDYFNYDGSSPNDGSDLDVELRLGASAEIANNVSVFSALHTGNGTMFFLGFSAGL